MKGRTMSHTLTIDDHSLRDLLEVARATRPDSWKLRKHPTRDGFTVYSPHGYVIHPDLGYVNDDNDAAFIATFDPAMVISLLERLAALDTGDSQH